MLGIRAGFRLLTMAASIGLLAACDIAPDEPVLDGNQKISTADNQSSGPKAEKTVSSTATPDRPNILLIVADDLGYFDIAPYGGEIRTPNLEKLANQGVRFRQFRSGPVCAPARAMLLTGLDSHAAGLGDQFPRGPQVGKPGYEGYLVPEATTIAEMLKEQGYHTFMAGKWHLGKSDAQSPRARGFDSSFSMLLGAGSHLDMTGPGPDEAEIGIYREDGERVDQLPKDFFSTRFYTDRILADVRAHRGDGQPFFAYVAYTAPHWPLQAPDDYIDRYQGDYDMGYEELCRSRLERASQMGVLPAQPDVSGCRDIGQPWDNLNQHQRALESRRMEVYAAMVENLDANVGRLLADLESAGELANTVVIFMSDNGADAGRREMGPDIKSWIEETADNSLDNIGRAGSFVSYGPGWASAGTSPFRGSKGSLGDGGIRVPVIVSHPELSEPGRWSSAAVTVQDVVPTLLNIAGIEVATAGGQSTKRITGRSFLPLLLSDQESSHSPDAVFAWEFSGSRSVIQSGWKLLNNRSREGAYTGWMLFDLSNDPFEMRDISQTEPERLKTMLSRYDEYAEQNGVVELSNEPLAP